MEQKFEPYTSGNTQGDKLWKRDEVTTVKYLETKTT